MNSTRRLKAICFLRLLVAFHFWFRNLPTENHLEYLLGSEDVRWQGLCAFLWVIAEMRDYVQQSSTPLAAKVAVEQGLSRSRKALLVCLAVTMPYRIALANDDSLPEIPWYLCINDYRVMLSIVGIVSGTCLRSIDELVLIAKVVFLFPARLHVPWPAFRGLFSSGTRHARYMADKEDRAGRDEESGNMQEVPTTAQGSDASEPGIVLSIAVVAVALRFWAIIFVFFYRFDEDKMVAITPGRVVLFAIMLALSQPWAVFLVHLKLLIAQGRATPSVKARLEANLSMATTISLVMQFVFSGTKVVIANPWHVLRDVYPVRTGKLVDFSNHFTFALCVGIFLWSNLPVGDWITVCRQIPRSVFNAVLPWQHSLILYRCARHRFGSHNKGQ